jgi:hypothetical protein
MTISTSESNTNVSTCDLIPGFSDNGTCKSRSLIASLSFLLHAYFISNITQKIYLAQPLPMYQQFQYVVFLNGIQWESANLCTICYLSYPM